MRSLAFWATVFLLLAPGCLQSETRLSGMGARPFVAVGYGYDGSVNQTEGFIHINVVDESNTGRVEAEWFDEGVFSLDWSNFSEAPDKPYQDGGIVFNIDAHGDSGNGDANLPNLHYAAAAWGNGRVVRNGEDFPDPLTGKPEFKLHFMALRESVRDPESKKILKADGARPYDPSSPTDGLTHPGVPEILLLVQSTVPGREASSASVRNINGTASATNYAMQHKVEVPEGATRLSIRINATTPGSGPLVVGQLTFRLIAPDGKVESVGTIGGVPQNRGIELRPAFPKPGTNIVDVRGNATGVTYTGDTNVIIGARVPYVRLISFENAEIQATGPRAGS